MHNLIISIVLLLPFLFSMVSFKDFKLSTMKYLLICIILVLVSIKSPCQTDTNSVYKNLEIKKSYAVNLESHFVNDKPVYYKVNGRRVDAKPMKNLIRQIKNPMTVALVF